MGNQIIQQPDGKYSIFSSNVDCFVVINAEYDEIVEYFKHKAAMDAEMSTNRLMKGLMQGNPEYFQFSKTWDDAVECSLLTDATIKPEIDAIKSSTDTYEFKKDETLCIENLLTFSYCNWKMDKDNVKLFSTDNKLPDNACPTCLERWTEEKLEDQDYSNIENIDKTFNYFDNTQTDQYGVIRSFNHIIKQNLKDGISRVTQKEIVISLADSGDSELKDIFLYGSLNIEDHYTRLGWEVEYMNPCIADGSAYFIFKVALDEDGDVRWDSDYE